MKKILLLLILISYPAFSTDLRVGRLLSPALFVDVNDTLGISYQVLNTNVLKANYYTGTITVRYNQTNETVLEYIGEYTELEPFDSVSITIPEKWTPTKIGSYTISINIGFSEDIDTSNNSGNFIIDVGGGECTSGYEWNEGIGFTIRRSLTHFPDAEALDGKMKPGDIIGIYCIVEDFDDLIAHCGCEEGINSKIMSYFPDEVVYDWSLVGEGTLYQPAAGDKNAVFYKIPICPKNAVGKEKTITEEILITARNKPTGLKPDKPISGKVTLTITYCPERYFPETGEASWDPTAMKITAAIQPLEPGESIDYTESDNGSCEPQPLAYDKYTPISVINNITETSVEGVCPDYAVILSALAADEDQVIIECTPETESPVCTEKSNKTVIAKDNLSYTWFVDAGKGEFPLGNKGSSVVFRKSQSEDADITCEIKNEFSMAEDPKVTIKYKVTKAKKPKAFVGLGDDEDTGDFVKLYHQIVHNADDIYGGKSSGFYAVAESMKNKYAAAGYDVTFAEYTSVGLLNSILEDPCYQAFCVVSHGTGGNVLLSGGTTRDYLDEYTSYIARKHNEAFWGCERNPSIRDVQLLACNALDSPWNDAFNCNARIHGYKEAKLLLTLRIYAFVQFRPYKPLTLALP